MQVHVTTTATIKGAMLTIVVGSCTTCPAEVEGLKRKLLTSLSPTSASLMTDWKVHFEAFLS